MGPLSTRLEDDPLGDGALSGRAIDEDDVFHRLSAMLRQEEFYLSHDYLQLLNEQVVAAPSNRDAIDETCRSKMCEWIFHVVDSTRLQRETAIVAMGYLDRFLSTPSRRAERVRSNRKEFQLAAMTCLYIAVKVRAGHVQPPELAELCVG